MVVIEAVIVGGKGEQFSGLFCIVLLLGHCRQTKQRLGGHKVRFNSLCVYQRLMETGTRLPLVILRLRQMAQVTAIQRQNNLVVDCLAESPCFAVSRQVLVINRPGAGLPVPMRSLGIDLCMAITGFAHNHQGLLIMLFGLIKCLLGFGQDRLEQQMKRQCRYGHSVLAAIAIPRVSNCRLDSYDPLKQAMRPNAFKLKAER